MSKKKYLYSIIGVITLVLAIGVGTTYAKDQVLRNNVISTTAAKNFAFLDAEVSENEITSLEIELEKEFGAYYYDIDFVVKGEKYSYHIDATNGKVISREVPMITSVEAPLPSESEKKADAVAAQEEVDESSKQTLPTNQAVKNENTSVEAKKSPKTVSPSTKSKPKTSSPYLPIEKVKEITLKNSGVNQKEAIFESTKLERENGRDIYEVEFFTDKKEFDYEIDAHTGEILHYSSEVQDKIAPSIIKEKQDLINKLESLEEEVEKRMENSLDKDFDEKDENPDYDSDDDNFDSSNDNDDDENDDDDNNEND